jgi:hypothetical protein
MSRLRGPGLLLFGVWLLFLVTNPGRNETIDVEMRRVVAHQLWSAGTVTVSAIPPNTPNWVPAGPGRWAAPYGVGQSLVFVPFDALGAFLERHSPGSLRDKVGWLPIGLILLPLLGVGLFAAIRALLREWGLPEPWPLAGALVTTFGTMIFHYVGQAQEEVLVAFLLTLSMLYAVRLRRRPDWLPAVLSGLFAGAALVVRPVSLFALLIVPALVLSAGENTRARLRLLGLVGAATAVSGSITLWYNYARFGSPFVIGYDRLGHVSKLAFDLRSPKIIASLLFGPGFGLMILSPVLFAAILGSRELWRRDRWYAIGALAAVVSCVVFFSCWHDSYTGGVAWGARYQCHLIPLFALPVILGLRRLTATGWQRRAAVALIAFSLTLQVFSILITHHLEYVQAECDGAGMMDDPLRNSPVNGQLERRIANLARWGLHRPPVEPNPACQANVDIMWDRYVPNFWGPVFAHRIARGGGILVTFWAAMLLAALGAIGLGIRRELGAAGARRPALEP